MSAFLRVADAVEDTDPEIQAWVKQVRDIAHDTDDVLDEFMLRFAHRHHHHNRGFYGSDIKARVIDNAERRQRRCEGLSLVIVVIYGVLASKDQGRVDEWKLVNRSLGAEVEGNDIKKILLLSYNDLPYHLKSCLLYLSSFPEDYLIKWMSLIRLWIAEGFVEVKEFGKTLEEVAEAYLYELLNRNLIQNYENNLKKDRCVVSYLLLLFFFLSFSAFEVLCG
ncbi:hypothetical protein ACSBR2_037566 [Camellia fascicularis]